MHACMHAFMHTCIHAYMHTCIHAYMHTYIHTYIHTYKKRTYMYACMHSCMHACVCVRTYAPTLVRARTHVWMHACMHASCMQAYIIYACIQGRIQGGNLGVPDHNLFGDTHAPIPCMHNLYQHVTCLLRSRLPSRAVFTITFIVYNQSVETAKSNIQRLTFRC